MPLRYNFEAIATDKELSKQIQVLLKNLDYLDSEADGNFGPVTGLALKTFQLEQHCGEFDYIGPATAKKLIEAKTEDVAERPLLLGNDLPSRIVRYMQSQGYKIFQGSRYLNICYVEGMDADGTPNPDKPNQFNDRRFVIQVVSGIPSIVGNWEATTEPGSYYTYKPMNPAGAARIKFGQYRAWRVGTHGNADPHEALVQVEPITVHRDFNKDFSRVGDSVATGLFGINQHWGYDLDKNDIENASAGCLVGRVRLQHREFMAIIKNDKRYMANKAYTFYTTIIPGDQLAA